MVNFDLQEVGMDTDQFLPKLAKYNILGSPRPPAKVRLVTHYGINKENIFTTIEAIKEIVSK
jgi:threonine aldolase